MPGLVHMSDALSIALHTCLWVSDGERKYQSSSRIAKELGFSYHHFAKVVQRLVRQGILETARGPHGGIRLAGDPHKLTLLDIYDATGGEPLLPHSCLLNPSICKGRACGLGRMIEEENTRLYKKMKQTTLASLAGSLDKSQLEIA